MEGTNGVEGGEKGGPPPPSPLTGCYLLVVIGEPYGEQHKDIILQRIAKGLLSWDVNSCLVDLEKELAIVTEQALEGEEARYGERLIQFASENLVTEILIHPVVSTLAQCMRNLLSSFTRHRHIIHAGYTFAANGSWALQDGTFSYADFAEAFQETEVQRVIRAYENSITLDIHSSPEGDWPRLPREPFAKACKVRVNPSDVLTSGSIAINNFTNYLAPFLVPNSLECLLESSDVVGNIRFSRPTLYVFPGGQGDAALFGINGFNMLLDGGFSRKACFWDFVRHLDRLDAVLMTRLNNSNVGGVSSVLRRKKQDAVYPQIGHFFCNIQERKTLLSPDGDKDKDPLLINLLDEGHEIISNLRHLNLHPQVCYRDSEPINLYHKVGHGTLDMYVLSPAKDAKEVRDFLQKWNQSDQKLFANAKSSREFNFPIQNLVSIAALLVWQPANPNDTITRILFPGSSPQRKIFEGLDRLKNLEFIKHPVCTEKSLVPISITKKTAIIERIKEKTPVEKKENKIIENNMTAVNGDVKEKTVRKSDSTESERSAKTKKPEEPKIMENGDKLKSRPKPGKFRSDSQQRKKPQPQKASPTTPKKTVENGETLKKPSKPSPISTPAKSAKDANNRKVIESKTRQAATKPPATESKPKPERKPISRRPKAMKAPISPIKKLVNGIQKPESISRKARLDKEGTTDSSTVSTPSADQESILKKDISKLTPEEIQQMKAQELADLKEEQEAIKEIEAVFRKGESQSVENDNLRKVKDDSIDEKLVEREEYIIIEKEEILQDSLDEREAKEDETRKLARDSEESEKQRKLSSEEQIIEKLPEIQSQMKGIVVEAEDIVKGKDELVTSKVTSPEEKLDSTDKKTTDKEVEEEVKDVIESQPEEKVSVNIKSGDTTTAPTLPEDERIPLDEIKEDNGQIEEKHIKEDTKEKEVPVIQLPPKPFDTITKLPNVVGIRLDKQSHIRDIVKTPDEVADLPVHEEVDYEYTHDLKPETAKTNEIVSEQKAADFTKKSKEQEKEIEQEKDKDEVLQQQIKGEVTDTKKPSAMHDELKTLTDTVLKNESAIEKDILEDSRKCEDKESLKSEIKEKASNIKDEMKKIEGDKPSHIDDKLKGDIEEKATTTTLMKKGEHIETLKTDADISHKKEVTEELVEKQFEVKDEKTAKDFNTEKDEKMDEHDTVTKDTKYDSKDIQTQSLKTEDQQAEHRDEKKDGEISDQALNERVEEIEQVVEPKVEIQADQIIKKLDHTEPQNEKHGIEHTDVSKEKDHRDEKEIKQTDKEQHSELAEVKEDITGMDIQKGETVKDKGKEDATDKEKQGIIEHIDQKAIDDTHKDHEQDKLEEKEDQFKKYDKKAERKDVLEQKDEKPTSITELRSYEEIEIEEDKIDDEFIKVTKDSRDRLTEIDDQLKHLKEAFSHVDGFGKPKDSESDEVEKKGEKEQIATVDIIEKIELGRKSPKEREDDVIKIVASVAEVLKSDAPLEEFEGKLPVSTYAPYSQSYTTELRETHITTVDSPIVESKPIRSDIIPPIPEEPHFASASFLEEERKISAVHVSDEAEDKRSNLLKESQELLKATSKMISEIKGSKPDEQTEEKPEEKLDEDDGCTVHRMLVTASSEDGGEETEICTAGTISVSKSSESSGRSSPEQSQKLSQKSSIVDTISDTLSTVKQVRDLHSEKDSGIDDTKSDTEESQETKIATHPKETDEVSTLEKSEKAVSEKTSQDKDASIKNLASGKSTPDISDFEKSKDIDETTKRDAADTKPDKLHVEEGVKDQKEQIVKKVEEIKFENEIKESVPAILPDKAITGTVEVGQKEEQEEKLAVSQNIQDKTEEIIKPVDETKHEYSIFDKMTDVVNDSIEAVEDTTKHIIEDISEFIHPSDKPAEDKSVIKEAVPEVSQKLENIMKDANLPVSDKLADYLDGIHSPTTTTIDTIHVDTAHDIKGEIQDEIKEKLGESKDKISIKTDEIGKLIHKDLKEKNDDVTSIKYEELKIVGEGISDTIKAVTIEGEHKVEDISIDPQLTKDAVKESITNVEAVIAETTQAAIDEKKDKASNIFSDIQVKVGDVKDIIVDKIDLLEHIEEKSGGAEKDMHHHKDDIIEKIKDRTDLVESKVEENTQSIEKEVIETNVHAKDRLEDIAHKTEEKVGDILSELKSADKDLKDKVQDATKGVSDKSEALLESVSEKAADALKYLDATKHGNENKKQETLSEIIESGTSIKGKTVEHKLEADILDKTDEKIDNVKDAIVEKVEQIEDNASKEIIDKSAVQKLEDKAHKAHDKVEGIFAVIKDTKNDLEEKLEDRIGVLEQKTTEVSKEVGDKKKDLEDKAKDITTSVGQKTKEVAGALSDIKDVLKDTVDDVMKSVDQTIIDVSKDISDKLKDTKDHLTEKAEDTHEAMKQKATDISKEFGNRKEDIKEKVEDTIGTFEQKVTDLKDKANDTIGALQQKIVEDSKEISEKTEHIKDQAEVRIGAIEQKVTEVTKGVSDKTEDLKYGTEDKIEALEQKVTEVAKEVSDKTGDLQDRAEDKIEALEEKVAEVAKEVSDKTEDLKDRAEDNIGHIGQHASDISRHVMDTVIDKVADTIATTEQKASEISKSVNDKSEGAKEDLNKKLVVIEQTTTEISDALKNAKDDMKVESENIIDSAKQSIINVVKDVGDKLSDTKKDLEDKVSDTIGYVEEKSTEISKDIVKKLKESEEVLKDKAQEDASNAEDVLKEKTADTGKVVEQKATDFTDKLNDTELELKDKAEHTIRVTEQKIEQVSKDQAKAIATQLVTKTDDILDDLTDTEADISAQLKGSGSDLKKVVQDTFDTTKKQTKDIVEDFGNTITKKTDDSLKSLGIAKDEAVEKFVESKHSAEQVITDVAKSIEKPVSDIKSSAEKGITKTIERKDSFANKLEGGITSTFGAISSFGKSLFGKNEKQDITEDIVKKEHKIADEDLFEHVTIAKELESDSKDSKSPISVSGKTSPDLKDKLSEVPEISKDHTKIVDKTDKPPEDRERMDEKEMEKEQILQESADDLEETFDIVNDMSKSVIFNKCEKPLTEKDQLDEKLLEKEEAILEKSVEDIKETFDTVEKMSKSLTKVLKGEAKFQDAPEKERKPSEKDEHILEDSATDIKETTENVEDMSKSVIFEKCDMPSRRKSVAEEIMEKVVEDLEDSLETVTDMSKSIVFEKCDREDHTEKSDREKEVSDEKVAEEKKNIAESDKSHKAEHVGIKALESVSRMSPDQLLSSENKLDKVSSESITDSSKSIELEKGEKETMEKGKKEVDVMSQSINLNDSEVKDVDSKGPLPSLEKQYSDDIVDSQTPSAPSLLAVVEPQGKKLSVSDVEISLSEEIKATAGEKTATVGDKAGPSSKETADKDLLDTLLHEKHIPGAVTPPTVPVSPNVADVTSEEVKLITKADALAKEVGFRSSTPASDDFEIVSSTQSDMSSDQMSKIPLDSDRLESDDEDQLSVTSQVAHSRDSTHYEFDEDTQRVDPMSMSFYGTLPGDSTGERQLEPTHLYEITKAKYSGKTTITTLEEIELPETDASPSDESVTHEEKKDEAEALGKPLGLPPPPLPTYLYEVTKAKYAIGITGIENLKEEIQKKEKFDREDLMMASFYGDLPSDEDEYDIIQNWGKPLGLPSPAPPSDNKGTPKKERKLPANVTAKNKLNDDRKRAESPSKYNKNKKINPVYVDLTYVPHHGNNYYSFVDFFRRVRARYYVFSGIEPSREVYNALLEAKQTWEEKDLEVTIIPTYDTDVLGYWVAENEDLLTKHKIDLSPSASRCTINLQDHETSCSAYRLEF